MDVISRMRREVSRWSRDRADSQRPRRIVLSRELAEELDDAMLKRQEMFGRDIKYDESRYVANGAVAFFLGVPVVVDLPPNDMVSLR